MNSRITTSDYEQLSGQSAELVRNAIRNGRYSGHTAGLAQGYLQCNLVILTADAASDFEHFCSRNSKACPLVSVSSAGQTGFNDLGAQIDLRTDLPLYNIYRSGKLHAQKQDVSDLWQEDFVAFAIGCSFTFERALIDAGISMRHVDLDLTVPMFKTNVPTLSAGVFGGQTVMSMRPVKQDRIQQVFDICSLYPHAHGEPMHIGSPEAIGITDLNSPDWGNGVPVYEDEIPVFWGCGVTSQAAVLNAAPELCITHAPGAMLITDSNELPA
ncbi:MAG: putative hydro-lyase [Granulosicoccus sp.]